MLLSALAPCANTDNANLIILPPLAIYFFKNAELFSSSSIRQPLTYF